MRALTLPNITRCVVALFCSSFLELGGLESAYVEYTLFGEVESNGMHMSVLANTYVCAGAVAVCCKSSSSLALARTHACPHPGPYPHLPHTEICAPPRPPA